MTPGDNKKTYCPAGKAKYFSSGVRRITQGQLANQSVAFNLKYSKTDWRSPLTQILNFDGDVHKTTEHLHLDVILGLGDNPSEQLDEQ